LFAVHELEPYFAGVVCTGGVPQKSTTVLLETALQQFGLRRNETLVLGDCEFNIQAGRAAGLQTCLYGQAALSEPADICVGHYSQLLSHLKEQNPC
jgi:FMN phosphatase YigB (HAD superfamily)